MSPAYKKRVAKWEVKGYNDSIIIIKIEEVTNE
jgi:hypothetical protein